MSTGDHLDWTVASGYSDSSGRTLSLYDAIKMDSTARQKGMEFSAYLHEQGVQQWVRYQPSGRFWTFQLIEAAIFTGLAAALIALVVVRIKRRVI